MNPKSFTLQSSVTLPIHNGPGVMTTITFGESENGLKVTFSNADHDLTSSVHLIWSNYDPNSRRSSSNSIVLSLLPSTLSMNFGIQTYNKMIDQIISLVEADDELSNLMYSKSKYVGIYQDPIPRMPEFTPQATIHHLDKD